MLVVIVSTIGNMISKVRVDIIITCIWYLILYAIINMFLLVNMYAISPYFWMVHDQTEGCTLYGTWFDVVSYVLIGCMSILERYCLLS
jgi:hypothetical protein